MPFKIVQTIEQGKNKLTTVPDQWEHNGVLYWPKSTKQEKLRKAETSVADYNKWSQINCIVKRKNISTFHDAEDEIDAMSNDSETETDIENQIPNKIQQLPKKTFNDMANAASTSIPSLRLNDTQCIDNNPCIALTRKNPMYPDTQNIKRSAPTSVTLGTKTTKLNDLPIIQINENDYIFEPVLLQEELNANDNAGTVLVTEKKDTNTKSILEEIKIIKDDIQTVIKDLKMLKNDIQTVTENQSILSSNQNTIISQISELSIKFEEFIKVSLSTKKSTNPSEFSTLKIFNEENLEEFERKLDQPDSKDELYRQYSVILNHGVGKGTTNAYTLVDAMFDRNFFTQCSWTGVSKGDTTKICFKGFTKTINFLFNIVHESDKTFTKEQLTKFFKTVLRNARYRSENEQARMSAQRQKQKGKLKTKKNILTSSENNLENPSSDQTV